MKTLDECKDEICEYHFGAHQFKWDELQDHIKATLSDKVAELYATSQIEDLTKEVEARRDAMVKYMVMMESIKTENDRYREALEVARKALATYGEHPIIEAQIDSALHPLVKEGE